MKTYKLFLYTRLFIIFYYQCIEMKWNNRIFKMICSGRSMCICFFFNKKTTPLKKCKSLWRKVLLFLVFICVEGSYWLDFLKAVVMVIVMRRRQLLVGICLSYWQDRMIKLVVCDSWLNSSQNPKWNKKYAN